MIDVALPESMSGGGRGAIEGIVAAAAQAQNAIPVFHAKAPSKIYHMGQVDVHVLRDVDLDIFKREFVVLLGPFRFRQVDAPEANMWASYFNSTT